LNATHALEPAPARGTHRTRSAPPAPARPRRLDPLAPTASFAGLPLQRCACGGGCPACRAKAAALAALPIHSADDVYEREADRVADAVMRGGSAPARTTAPALPAISRLQRCSCGGSHAGGGMCPECAKKQEEMQRSASGAAGPGVAPPIVHEVLRSPGEPLDPASRAFFEPRFGRGFGDVRVHTDGRAAESARAVEAVAYTVGRNVVFGAGAYRPGSAEGRRLLAHELTHVVQQGAAAAPAGGALQRAAIHTGRILDEGTCEHLACNSRWACPDPNGVLCPAGTRNAGGTFRPLFTCDANCENNRSCSDTGDWMAIPHSRFERRKCGQDLVICANNRFTHAHVRDRSEGEFWEVSRGIQDALGVPHGTFSGAVYGSETDAAFLTDSRCRAAAPAPAPAPAPRTGPDPEPAPPAAPATPAPVTPEGDEP